MVTMNARVIPPSSTPNSLVRCPRLPRSAPPVRIRQKAAKLTAALPKLKAAADGYPDTASGITARYHYASALAALGKSDEATAGV
jgi:hypothetical protein